METLPNGAPIMHEDAESPSQTDHVPELIVTDESNIDQVPMADSENTSDQSDLDRLANPDDDQLGKEGTQLQLLPPLSREDSPIWGAPYTSVKMDERYSKIDLSNLKLHASKASLISAMDRFKVPKPFRNKTSDDTKLRFFVGFVFLCSALLIGSAHILYFQHLGEVAMFPGVTYEEVTRKLRFTRPDGQHIAEVDLGVGLHPKHKPFNCNSDPHVPVHGEQQCLEWYNQARLVISQQQLKDTVTCYNIHWESLSPQVSPTDCFLNGVEYSHKLNNTVDADNLKEQGYWYGGGESLKATWPLQDGSIKLSPFVTGDEGQTEWGNAIKKYFLNSRGIALIIDDHSPLFVSINDKPKSGLCLQSKFDELSYYYNQFREPHMNYSICFGENVKKIHDELLPKSFWDGHRQRDLDTLHHLLKNPIWQVPADETFSHEALERFIRKMVKPKQSGLDNFGNGYLLLDYHWQAKIGDLKFDKINFPNPNMTVQMIRNFGLKMVLTVSPFISTESENFALGVQDNIFVTQRKTSGNVPALTWFKDVASCGMLDMTSNVTARWFRKKIRKLVDELNVDLDTLSLHEEKLVVDEKTIDYPVAFFVQTGNTFHTPSYFQFEVPLDNPDLFREHFVGHVMSEVPVIGVSGASARRPKAPAFIFMSTLEPRWSHLRSIVPNVLQLSVIGYPFINPGPIGGVPPTDPYSNSTTLSDESEFELYVRWWQLNTFLPLLHFVKPPNAFPESAISGIALSLKTIRTKVVLPELIRFANEAMHSSAPIIRPLWMISPTDPITHTIDDQFLIGDTILVAPILEYGCRSRNVYLPMLDNDSTVVWKQGTDGTFYHGGRWLNNTRVELNEVLYFVRQKLDTIPGLERI